MTRKFRISRKQKKAIEEAVSRAESRTSGEIVPMIVRQSHNYWWVHWYWAGLFVSLVSATLWWSTSDQYWALYLHEWLRAKTDYTFWNIRVHDAIVLQLCAAFFGFAIAFFEPIKRMVLPRKWTDKQVHSAALANFVATGLTETRDRTGVLIFISHLEHRVEILADKGINEKVPAGFWKQQSDRIVKGIHEKQAAEAIIKSILEIGDMLAQNYPARHDDTNELSNSLRLGGHQGESNDENLPSPPAYTPAPPPTPAAATPEALEAEPDTETYTDPKDDLGSASEDESPFVPETPADFPRDLLEDDELNATETTNPNVEAPDQEPSDSPLGELNLEDEDTQTNFNIGELPSIHLEDSSPFQPKKKRDDDEE